MTKNMLQAKDQVKIIMRPNKSGNRQPTGKTVWSKDSKDDTKYWKQNGGMDRQDTRNV